jgi:hypothetical protein
MPLRHALALLILSLTLGLLAACGGGGGEPTATVEPTAEATGEPTGEPDDEATEEPTVGPVSLPFDSFHYTVELMLVINAPQGADQPGIEASVEGDYVGPDSHAFTNSFSFAGLSGRQDVVIIGEQAWFREGSGAWRATSIDDPDIAGALDLSSADPEFLYDREFIDDLRSLDSEREVVEGVSTRRYHIPRESLEALGALLGEDFLAGSEGLDEFEFTVWLEEETGMLVRGELVATASPEFFGEPLFEVQEGATISVSLRIALTQIDDPTILIEPPI